MWFMFVIPFVIFFVVFLGIAKSFFRSHKKVDDTMQNMINTVSAYTEKAIENAVDILDEQNKTKTCEYCGSVIAYNSSKCESCGAKIKK